MTPPSLCVLRWMVDLPKLIPVLSEVALLGPMEAWMERRGRAADLFHGGIDETGQQGRDDLPTKQG